MLNKKVMIVSLGCDKNLVDTEKMLGILADEGCTFTDDEAQAQVIIVNTCCFIGDAKEESIQNILDLARFKTEGKLEALIATGCLSQRYQDEMLEELPELDGILGISAWHTIADVVREALEGKRPRNLMPTGVLNSHTTKRLLTTGGHYAYLKIAEGCDNRCTYCTIPSLRGKYRSRNIESLVKEAQILADKGVRELILIAQDTSLYGKDLYGEQKLHVLLQEISKIEDIKWIRILYCYPENVYDELIDEMASNPKVLHYLDMPVQHTNDRILKLMGRRSTGDKIKDTVNRLRAKMPDMCIRTTLITGFPTETQEEFESVIDFMKEVKFDRLGVFTYSPEEGTPACRMDGQIDEEIKAQRKESIMEAQMEISAELGQKFVGKTLEVIVEGKIEDEDDLYCGRSFRDCYEIDGFVFFKSSEELIAGDFYNIKITSAGDYDLIGERVE